MPTLFIRTRQPSRNSHYELKYETSSDFRPECSSKSNRDRTSVETLNDFIRIRMKLVCMQVYAAMSLISIDAALLFSFLFFFFFRLRKKFYLFIYLFFFINVLIEFFDLIRTNEVRENIFQY